MAGIKPLKETISLVGEDEGPKSKEGNSGVGRAFKDITNTVG